MKLALVFYLNTVILSANGGLVKNMFDEVHKLKHSIFENVVGTIAKETKIVVGEIGDLLHIGKNKKATPSNQDTRTTTSVNKLTSAIMFNNNKDINDFKEVNTGNTLKKSTLPYLNIAKENEDSSNDYNYGEGIISPRMGKIATNIKEK
ncbi:unnamed protein product, partial [Brenthis ino]